MPAPYTTTHGAPARIALCAATILAGCVPDGTPGNAPYPASTLIEDVTFDWDTWIQRALGSDNWPVTWAADNHQYTTWGDGGGFGGTNEDGRVSLGVARVRGDRDAYTGENVLGGVGGAEPPFSGKSYGILSLGSALYLWRCGDASDQSAYEVQELHRSDDQGVSWRSTGVRFTPSSFSGDEGFFCPAFLQFGQDLAQAPDSFVYAYAPEVKVAEWDIHRPGEITLFRTPREGIEDPSRYEFFAGLDGTGEPTWTSDPNGRAPVFEDTRNGVMRTSVTYNAGLDRYLLATEHTASHAGNVGIYESARPWGPWRTVLFEEAFGHPTLQPTTFFWAFSNKWTSEDGTRFVMIFSGTGAHDSWNSVEGAFVLRGNAPSP